MEPIGLASGLLTLVLFTHKACVELYQTVKSFKGHPTRVSYLLLELDALRGVLESLMDTVKSATGEGLSALDAPVLRCGRACEEFTKELLKCCSRSGADRTSFRDWARLRYLGDDVDGFRNTLASYKLTINIALTDMALRKGAVTAQHLGEYRELIETATSELGAHLSSIDEKIESMTRQAATDAKKADLDRINEDRISTQNCLVICSELSKQIEQAKPLSNETSSQENGTLSEKATQDSLEQCQSSLSQTVMWLEGRMQTLVENMMAKSSSGMTHSQIAEMTRLKEDWQTVRQCRDICSQADQRLRENISFIDNHVTGDENVQFLVSNCEKTVRGTNRGYGNKIRQVGGHLNDESIQKISGDFKFASTETHSVKGEAPHGNGLDVGKGTEDATTWHGQYGAGRKL